VAEPVCARERTQLITRHSNIADMLHNQCCSAAEQRYLRYDAPPRLIIASTVRRCDGPDAGAANRLNWISVVNKLDYAHLHGVEFWLHAEQVHLL
jgi:hypothetical protein